MRSALPPYARLQTRRVIVSIAGRMASMLPRRLWPRLCLLVLAAIGPFVALLLVSAIADGRREVEMARQRLVQMARLAAEQQDDIVQEASTLLRVLARVPDVRLMNTAECDTILTAAIALHARITGFAVAGVDGLVACSTNPATKGLSIGDRDYFQDALKAPLNTIVMGSMTVSRATGKPAVFIATPLDQPASLSPGAAPGVILLGIDLQWFARLSDKMPGLPNQIVKVLDSRDGALLAQAPDRGHRAGERLLADPLIEAFKAAPEGGALQARDLDGVDRVFGFAPLAGRANGLLIAIGLTAAEVRAPADERFWLSIAVATMAIALASVTAWLVAQLTLLHPIGALAAAAAQVGSGDMSARVSMGRGASDEFRALGAAFTRMARRLQARDGRIAAMQGEIAVSEGHHRLLAENANDMISRLSPDLRCLYVSPACRDILGRDPLAMVGVWPGDAVHLDDRESLRQAFDDKLRGGQPTARAIYRARHGTGRYVWLETSGRRLEDGSGFVAVTRDVSERMALEAQLEDANRQLRVLAREDGLTGLSNRRRFDEAMGEEFRRATRVRSPLALLMLDVDRFKLFNDTYGHPAGDACLRAIASVIQQLARRPADLAARYGGEEFVVLLPDTDTAGAAVLAECVRTGVRDLLIAHAGSESGVVTVSIGVAIVIPSMATSSPAELIEAADTALYQAKNGGRDTVRLAGAQVPAQMA